MRGNSLRFLKPSVFIKTFLVFCAIFAAMLSISCKQLASFEPSVDGARVVVSKTFSAPTDLTATQGRKQKISLEWTPVSGAKYYEIHSAKSATAEFEKIYETDKNSFDDKVSAGSTRYYKVCAVKSNGTKSAFSTIVKGTSLAQPVISGGTITESTAIISWFMENARGINEDNYEEFLKFEVFCEGGSDTLSQTFDAKEMSSYECKFDNLASSTEYTFYVVAYTTKDQQSTEQTPRVNKNTLTSYTPLAPTFNASEGTSAEGIWLNITLPKMVKVNTVTKISPDEKVDEPYPLYFKVFRRIVDTGSYDEVCDLYYNGTEFTTDPVKYQEGGAPYKAGETGAWFDNDVNLRGGEKYEYKIISYSDTAGYDTVVCPEGTENNSTSTPDDDDNDKSSKAVGWKCALPSFKVKFDEDGGRTLSAGNTEVLSISFGFSAEWNDLGKAGEYKFAIKQNRKLLKASDSSAGDDTWLKNGETIFFETLDGINSYKVKFGSENDGLDDDEKGVYSYTLYIVSKSETEVDESKVLVNVAALDTIQVTEDVNLPEALLDVEGGYKDKVVLEISKFDNEVKYKITRIMLEGSPQEGESKEQEFDLAVFYKRPDGKYEDNSVQGNCRYSYILTATNPSGAWKKSPSREAETLGTPDVSFNREALSYDSITISFYGVLAAEKYVVQFGASGNGSGFGGGATFEITKNGDEWVGSSSGDATAKVDFAANKFTVTINKPEGYDDATKAGDTAELTVTAHSSNDNAPSGGVPVNVVGPALLGATVNTFEDAKEDSISVTWKAVEGAKGYLIRRVMYSDAAMTKPAEGSGVTYYYEVASGKIKADGEDADDSVAVESGENSFKLTDTYKEADTDATAELQVYQEAQAKIAWGLPFRYVVLPVLNSDDFDFESNSLALKSGSKVMYNDLTPTKATATWGYGLNLVAEKAMSGTTQNIKWETPNTLEGKQMAVYRREYKTGGNADKTFSYVNMRVDSENASILMGNDDLYTPFEYVVKYYKTGASPKSNIELPESLFKEIEGQKEDEVVTPNGKMIEQKNKGYLLSMDFKAAPYPYSTNVDTDTKYEYAERISWDSWEYDLRAVGPETLMISLRNNNIGTDGKDVVEIKVDKGTGVRSIEIKKIDDFTTVEQDTETLFNVIPTGIPNGEGTSDGMLKVLRDYRHYYTFKLTNGENSVSYEKVAYRQMTLQEFARMSNLVLAEGLHRVNGTAWNTAYKGTLVNYTRTVIADAPGNGNVYAESNFGVTSWNITYANYEPAFSTKTGEIVKVAKANGTFNPKTGASNQYPNSYDGGEIIITLSGMEAQTGTIKFNSLTSGSGTITVTFNGKSGTFYADTPLPFSGGGYKYNDEQWQ